MVIHRMHTRGTYFVFTGGDELLLVLFRMTHQMSATRVHCSLEWG